VYQLKVNIALLFTALQPLSEYCIETEIPVLKIDSRTYDSCA